MLIIRKEDQGIRGVYVTSLQGHCKFVPWFEVVNLRGNVPDELYTPLVDKVANYNPNDEILVLTIDIAGKVLISTYRLIADHLPANE